jgi:tetratricopeptide (TPR) repeat protein
MAEKTINEIAREARSLFQKASEAAQRENFDYATTLFCQILDREPGFFEGRKALRAVQARKAGSGGGGFFKKMLSGAGSSPLVAKGQIALHTNPANALSIAEQILNSDPTSSGGHKLIVDAANALDFPKTAVMSLEVLVKNSPRDKQLAIDYANKLAESGGDASAGERVLQELMRTSPYDPDLVQALKNLSASKTLDEGGYNALEGGGGSFRSILKNKEESVSIEQENRVQKSDDVVERLINEYEARLQTEKDNIRLVRQLAELYTQKKKFDRALEYYERVRQSPMGGDATLEQAISNTVTRRYDYQLEQLNPAAPDYAAETERIKAEKINFQMTECQRRVEKYPTDLALRFEMGLIYFQSGKIGEAIQEFQKAQNYPHKRLASMNYLAQCFAKRKMFDPAVRTLQSAIKEKVGFDEEKKELIYQLGCVLETMGKKEEAIQQFILIYESDIGYKDVAAKVDAYYASQG